MSLLKTYQTGGSIAALPTPVKYKMPYPTQRSYDHSIVSYGFADKNYMQEVVGGGVHKSLPKGISLNTNALRVRDNTMSNPDSNLVSVGVSKNLPLNLGSAGVNLGLHTYGLNKPQLTYSNRLPFKINNGLNLSGVVDYSSGKDFRNGRVSLDANKKFNNGLNLSGVVDYSSGKDFRNGRVSLDANKKFNNGLNLSGGVDYNRSAVDHSYNIRGKLLYQIPNSKNFKGNRL